MRTDAPPSLPAGFTVLGSAIEITAPPATAAQPLEFTFRFDVSVVPLGVPLSSVAIFRDGIVVQPCSGAPGVASPDPCVSSRARIAGDDADAKRLVTGLLTELGHRDVIDLGGIETARGTDAVYRELL